MDFKSQDVFVWDNNGNINSPFAWHPDDNTNTHSYSIHSNNSAALTTYLHKYQKYAILTLNYHYLNDTKLCDASTKHTKLITPYHYNTAQSMFTHSNNKLNKAV